MTEETPAQSPRRAPGLAVPASGLIAAAVLVWAFQRYGSLVPEPGSRALVGYLVFWVPLVAATAWWARSYPVLFRSLIRIRPIDLLWGLVVGLLARAAASILDWLIYGTTSSSVGLPTLDGTAPNPWMVALATVIAPVLLAPLVEELFFRGVVLSSLRAESAGRGTAVVAVVASAVIFAGMHLLQVTNVTTALAVGASTLLIGLATATLTVTTGRLGAALVAHVVFNAAVVLPAVAP